MIENLATITAAAAVARDAGFPAEVSIERTGEVLHFSHFDFEWEMGPVAEYVGYGMSPTRVQFTLVLALAFRTP